MASQGTANTTTSVDSTASLGVPARTADFSESEARPQATGGASPERNRGVGGGRGRAEEAVGPELERRRVAIAAAMRQGDRRFDLRPRGDDVAAELEGLAAHDAS